MREYRRRIRALVTASLVAGALSVVAIQSDAWSEPAPSAAPSVAGSACPCAAEAAAQHTDACLQAKLQELARQSREYVPVLRRGIHEPMTYQRARPLLQRWEAVLRLAAAGPRAPRAEVISAVGDSRALLSESLNFRLRYPLALDVGTF